MKKKISVVIAATGYAGGGPNANLPVALGGIITLMKAKLEPR